MKSGVTTFCCLILSFHILSASCGDIIYVKADATGMNDGSSWLNAYTGLQLALDDARLCPLPQEIWVSYGTYKPTVDISGGTSSGEKNFVFFIDFDVELYGGFCGWESSRDERMKYLCPSILSGDHNDDDVLITDFNDPAFPADSTSDNSYNVMRIKCLSAATVVDEFTIRGGRAFHSNTFSKQTGGGIYMDANACPTYLTISNCVFEHNAASRSGGAIFQYLNNTSFTSPSILNCIFRYNYGQLVGGAIGSQALAGTSSPLIQNCLFTNNVTGFAGGAIAISAIGTGVISDEIQNSTFYGNRSFDKGGALSIASETTVPDQVNILNSIFDFNFATNSTIDANDGNNFIIQNTNVDFSYCLYPESDGSNNNSNAFPLFESASSGDFRLRKNSAGVDQGSNTVFIQNDLNGNKRNINGIDIGAYEYLACPLDNYIYVSSDNLATSGDGTSWENAVGDLTMALEMACDCDSTPTIAMGMTYNYYIPSRDINFIPSGRGNSFDLSCNAIIREVYESGFGRDVICSGDIFRNDGTAINDSIAVSDNVDQLWTISGSIFDDPLACQIIGVDFTGGNRAVNCRASGGGGSINFDNCQFYNNSNSSILSTINYSGFFTDSISAKISFENCFFKENGDDGGSQIQLRGTGRIESLVENCTFIANKGRALDYYTGDSSVHLIENSGFIGDTLVKSEALTVSVFKDKISNLKIRNSIFANMHSDRSIVFLDRNYALNTSITNCTFTNLYVEPFRGHVIRQLGIDGSTTVHNTIFWDLGDRFFGGSNIPPTGVNYSLLDQDCDVIGLDCDEATVQNADNPFGGGSITYCNITTIPTSLHDNSDALDSGNNLVIEEGELDFAGRARIQNNVVDIGARENRSSCISHLILDVSQEPFLSSNGIYGTWQAEDSITIVGGLQSIDPVYLSLNAPNVIINGNYERTGGGTLEIRKEGCFNP